MQNLWKEVLPNLLHPRYPEYFVFYGFMVFFLWLKLPTPYPFIFVGLSLVGSAAGILAIFQPKRFVVFATLLGLLAMVIGILQFNFIPSLAIWLLIFTRFLLVDRKYNYALLLTTTITAIISMLAAHYFLTPIYLSVDEQHILEFFSLIGCVMVVSVFFRRLILRLQHFKKESLAHETRIRTFVEVTNKLVRFLPPQVWQPLIKSNKPVEVISNRRKLTILFSDIVGFTDLSDNISPDHLANILNTYFDRMTQITLRYGATLDKFLGDGLLCYFGDAPNSNDRECAIRCANMAIDMRREMEVMRQQWRLLGFEGLYVRIGINTGYCYVGNFGSPNRMTYTVIGREANFASRLESAAKKNQILISESTYNLISHEHNCQLVGEMRLKGLQNPMPIWQLLDPNAGEKPNNNWVDYNLPGFNLHLNFQDIRNYDKRTILNYLNNALELVENRKEK